MVTKVSYPSAAPNAPARPTDPVIGPDPVNPPQASRSTAAPGSVAATLTPLIEALVGMDAPVRFEFWDGSGIGPTDGTGTLHLRSADALRRILWAPGELGVARAFVAGDLTVDADIFDLLRVLRDSSRRPLRRTGVSALSAAIQATRRLGAFGPPLPAPPEECRPSGRLHSPTRDATVVSHHYDVGNESYRLVLGPSMTYSCARFATDETSLEEAQAAKHELICRKLGLDRERPGGTRLLDVGCGWGSMAIHAARHHQVAVTGIALSRAQVDEAKRRVVEAGLADRVEIWLQDYRDLIGSPSLAVEAEEYLRTMGGTP